MGSMITPEVHRKGAGGAALLCHIWHCFQMLRCNNAMDEEAAMERNLLNNNNGEDLSLPSAHMYVADSASAHIEI